MAPRLSIYRPLYYVIKSAMASLTDKHIFVAAIDIGTIQSGYAFSSINDFARDPLNINSAVWNTGCGSYCSIKTPTCVLLDHKEEFISFGYEAENMYSEIVCEDEQNEYFFFHRFKMELYKNKQIKDEMIIKDVTDKPVTAMKVFGASIKFFMDHLLKILLSRYGADIMPEDIRWVLTVPTIWSDAGKQFMRKSAILAGIKDNKLIIALEPETASIYCQYLNSAKGAEMGFSRFEEGTQYMVVDIGGGTTDITVHEILSNSRLKELCCASGGDCGGASVDDAFYQIFVKLVGAPLMNKMKIEDSLSYLELFRDFAAVKQRVSRDQTCRVMMPIPRMALDDICMKHLQEDFNEVVQSSPYHDKMTLRRQRMIIDNTLMIDMFKQPSERIIELISDALKKMEGSNLQMIILVGGFSNSEILQHNIKSFFPNYRVIVPEGAELAVFKGAVLFGHKADMIVTRIARYTYGVDTLRDFNPDIHDAGRCVVKNGKKKCRNLFHLYIKGGSVVELGNKITHIIDTFKPFQSRISFPIVQSNMDCPQYTDEEGCTTLGTLKVDIQDPSEEIRKFRVNMIFGDTELKVTAFDVKSGVECATVLDLI